MLAFVSAMKSMSVWISWLEKSTASTMRDIIDVVQPALTGTETELKLYCEDMEIINGY